MKKRLLSLLLALTMALGLLPVGAYGAEDAPTGRAYVKFGTRIVEPTPSPAAPPVTAAPTATPTEPPATPVPTQEPSPTATPEIESSKPMMKSRNEIGYNDAFYAYRDNIVTIEFIDSIDVPDDAIGEWNIGVNGDVIAWLTTNAEDSTKYDLHIGEIGGVIAPTDFSFFFCNFELVKTIKGLDNLDTSNVTDMEALFYCCYKLTSLDLSSVNTSNVTNMKKMLGDLWALPKLDVSSFDTSNVTDMDCMFRACAELTSLDLSNFNTSKVTNMREMLNGCHTLTKLDISSFDTSNVTDMFGMFAGLYELTSLDVSNFNTSNVTNMNSMFSCPKLNELDVSSFDTSKVTNMSGMFSDCLELVNLDLRNFDTSNVTDMSGMFGQCYKLINLDVSSFNTSNVTNMESTFLNCQSLTDLNVSNFNTANVVNMYGTFCQCYNLTTLNLSNFDTSNVISMRDMFDECYKLSDLDLSSFDTSKVTDVRGMFYLCGSSADNFTLNLGTKEDGTAKDYLTVAGKCNWEEWRFNANEAFNALTLYDSNLSVIDPPITTSNASSASLMSLSSYSAMPGEDGRPIYANEKIGTWDCGQLKVNQQVQYALEVQYLGDEGAVSGELNITNPIPDGLTIDEGTITVEGPVRIADEGATEGTYTQPVVKDNVLSFSVSGLSEGAKIVVKYICSAPSTEPDEYTEYLNTATVTDNGFIDAADPVLYYMGERSIHQHTYEATVVPPTCTMSGYTIHICSGCGDRYIDSEIEASGHDYILNQEKSVAPEKGKDGYDYYECSHDSTHNYTVPVFAPIITHTATFMVGDEVIGRVEFEEGSASLTEPALPVRENYVGAWEDYDLASAVSDITIHGHYTPIDPNKVSDVESDADAKYENGAATITLNASAASKTIKMVSEHTTPVDVVLVLDQSGSMANTMSASDKRTKRDALVNCADEFAQSLYENALKTGADHRVAVVGFACSEYNKGTQYNPNGCNNTGLLTTSGGKAVNYKNLKDSDYKTALLSINDGGAINANVTAGINSIVANGATAADLGLRMAQNIFAENPTYGNRQRIVIFITDGTPTSWSDTASQVRPTAADAISIANNIKNGQDAKIYSIGVHSNANADASFTSYSDGIQTDWRGNFVSYDFNRFLHAVSSNYPDARSMGNMGAGDKASGYYMAVTDTGNLSSIFTNILYSTVYQLKTFDKVSFHYTLPAEFTLTLEQEMEMRDSLKSTLGINDTDIIVERKTDGNTELHFYNIPAKEAYDENGTIVYKATVSFRASANRTASGSIHAGEGGAQYDSVTVSEFEAPVVTVPSDRKLIVFTINGEVYQITEAELGDSIVVPDSRLARWKVEPGTTVTENYAVIEAAEISHAPYSITWDMNGTKQTQSYVFGEKITPPDPTQYAPDGYEFSRWSMSVPATMPAYDLTCAAIYSPLHVHNFAEAYKSGTCDEGITTVYRCTCGEEKSEQAAPEEHNYTAVFSDNGSSGNTVSKLTCTKCGHSEEQNITFKVSYSENRRSTVLDLSLYQNEVNITQPDEDVEIRFYIGEDDNKTYTITRIDEDGKRTTYRGKAKDGYLVFKANHFSIYVIGEVDENGTTEEVSYEKAVEILDSKVDAVDANPGIPETGPLPSAAPTIRPSHGGSSSRKPIASTPTPIPLSAPDNGDINTAVTNPFADVSENDYYYDAVLWAVANDVTEGITATTFAPEKDCSRAEAVTLLWRTAGQPEPDSKKCPFTDVDKDAYYYKAVLWATEQGITVGTRETSFNPNEKCSRAQIVTFLWRANGHKSAASNTLFTDVQSNAYYAEAVSWAIENGVTFGTSNTTFSPSDICNRGQIVTFLYRLTVE